VSRRGVWVVPTRMVRRALAVPAVIGLWLLGSSPALAAWTLNLREGVTELSREIYGLHMLVLWVCVAIAVAVFSVMIYSIATFRKSKGAVPATFDHSTGAEVTWTIIPVVILVAMAIPAARTLVKIEDASGSELTVKVTGYQWKWQYDYVDHGVAYFSTLASSHNEARQVDSGIDVHQVEDYLLEVDNPLVVPVGRKVRVLVTAADVIHNWWVPDFGLKRDAIPGYINELWFRADQVGTYRGQCAELCGRDHGFMPVVVRVVEQAEFDAWLAGQQAARQASAVPAMQAADLVAPIANQPPARRVAAAE
jgi:cytochrome c oxidase subunit 2